MSSPSEPVGTSWVRDVTRDAVRHFAWGVGDDNPLWLDPAYAGRSRHGGIVAPPCFPYAIHETTLAPGFPERPRLYHAVDWRWFDAIRLGTSLAPRVEVGTSEAKGPDTLQHGRVSFGGEAPVATVRVACLRPARSAVPVADARRYTAEELAEIEASVLAETRRGAQPRFYEETAVGDEVEPRTKGPLSIMDIVAWCAGTTGVPPADSEGSAGGLADEFASGPQVSAWLAHLVTDWAGDDAFVHRLELEHHAFPGLGTTTRLHGTLAERRATEGTRAVAIALRAVDQDDVLLASGTATVLLPSRETGPVSLPLGEEANRP